MSNTRRDKVRVKMRRAVDEWFKKPITPREPCKLEEDAMAHYHHWTSRYPHWWDTLYHHAPARRHNREKLKDVVKGVEDDGDWRDHRRPHKYYW